MRMMMLLGGSTTILGTIIVTAALLNAAQRMEAQAGEHTDIRVIPIAHVQAD